MAATQVRGAQVKDASIQRADVDTSTPGQAIVAKLVQGAGIQLSSTGGDAGTGDVTVAIAAAIPIGLVTTLYIGSRARFTALINGLRLEVFDGASWITQQEWTE